LTSCLTVSQAYSKTPPITPPVKEHDNRKKPRVSALWVPESASSPPPAIAV
jgi:hypothetical protein